ncbi:MAG: HAD-IIIC family phosphatase, partial [Candidatus Omnitrophica bacterium]|nr:HAD-IIIC family phosphatase [Candidatus Omnitrophota bacterium]
DLWKTSLVLLGMIALACLAAHPATAGPMLALAVFPLIRKPKLLPTLAQAIIEKDQNTINKITRNLERWLGDSQESAELLFLNLKNSFNFSNPSPEQVRLNLAVLYLCDKLQLFNKLPVVYKNEPIDPDKKPKDKLALENPQYSQLLNFFIEAYKLTKYRGEYQEKAYEIGREFFANIPQELLDSVECFPKLPDKEDSVSAYLRALNLPPYLLSHIGEVVLSARFKLGDDSARTYALFANMRLIAGLTHKFKKRNVGRLDLIQEGALIMFNKFAKFDPAHPSQSRMSTYFVYWIDQAMRRARNAQGSSVVVKHGRIAQVEQLIKKCAGENIEVSEIRALEPQEIARASGKSLKEVKSILGGLIWMVSFDRKVSHDDDRSIQEVESFCANDEENKFDTPENVSFLTHIVMPRAKMKLSHEWGVYFERNWGIFYLRHFCAIDRIEPMKLREISLSLGDVGTERVRQIATRGLEVFKETMKEIEHEGMAKAALDAALKHRGAILGALIVTFLALVGYCLGTVPLLSHGIAMTGTVPVTGAALCLAASPLIPFTNSPEVFIPANRKQQEANAQVLKKEIFLEPHMWDIASELLEKIALIRDYYHERMLDKTLRPKWTKGGLYYPSGTEFVVAIAEQFLKDNPRAKVLDLGSGTAKAVALFSLYGRTKGIEIDEFLHGQASQECIPDLIAAGAVEESCIELSLGNFLKEDFSQYDLIYIYWPCPSSFLRLPLNWFLAWRLERKLFKELKPGAVFVVAHPEGVLSKNAFSRLTRLIFPYADREVVWEKIGVQLEAYCNVRDDFSADGRSKEEVAQLLSGNLKRPATEKQLEVMYREKEHLLNALRKQDPEARLSREFFLETMERLECGACVDSLRLWPNKKPCFLIADPEIFRGNLGEDVFDEPDFRGDELRSKRWIIWHELLAINGGLTHNEIDELLLGLASDTDVRELIENIGGEPLDWAADGRNTVLKNVILDIRDIESQEKAMQVACGIDNVNNGIIGRPGAESCDFRKVRKRILSLVTLSRRARLPHEFKTLAAFSGDTVVGYIMFSCIKGMCYVRYLAVYPAFQHCGIGFELFKRALIIARNEGCHTARVDTNVRYTAARRLYEKAGRQFLPIDTACRDKKFHSDLLTFAYDLNNPITEDQLNILLDKVISDIHVQETRNVILTVGSLIGKCPELFSIFKTRLDELVYPFGLNSAGIEIEEGYSGDIDRLFKLLTNKNELMKFLLALSVLRVAFADHLSDDSELTPLEYARKEGLIFQYNDFIKICPVAQSFRRHILIVTGSSGREYYLEVKIPGQSDVKRYVTYTHSTLSKKAWARYGKDSGVARIVGMVSFLGAFLLYENIFEETNEMRPMYIAIFKYEDGKRLVRDCDSAVRRDDPYYLRIAKARNIPVEVLLWDVTVQVVRISGQLLDLGYIGRRDTGTDFRLENFRLLLDGRVISVADFGAFEEADLTEAEKKEEIRKLVSPICDYAGNNEKEHSNVDRCLARLLEEGKVIRADVDSERCFEHEQFLAQWILGKALNKAVHWHVVRANENEFTYRGHIHEYSDYYDIFVREDLIASGTAAHEVTAGIIRLENGDLVHEIARQVEFLVGEGHFQDLSDFVPWHKTDQNLPISDHHARGYNFKFVELLVASLLFTILTVFGIAATGKIIPVVSFVLLLACVGIFALNIWVFHEVKAAKNKLCEYFAKASVMTEEESRELREKLHIKDEDRENEFSISIVPGLRVFGIKYSQEVCAKALRKEEDVSCFFLPAVFLLRKEPHEYYKFTSSRTKDFAKPRFGSDIEKVKVEFERLKGLGFPGFTPVNLQLEWVQRVLAFYAATRTGKESYLRAMLENNRILVGQDSSHTFLEANSQDKISPLMLISTNHFLPQGYLLVHGMEALWTGDHSQALAAEGEFLRFEARRIFNELAIGQRHWQNFQSIIEAIIRKGIGSIYIETTELLPYLTMKYCLLQGIVSERIGWAKARELFIINYRDADQKAVFVEKALESFGEENNPGYDKVAQRLTVMGYRQESSALHTFCHNKHQAGKQLSGRIGDNSTFVDKARSALARMNAVELVMMDEKMLREIMHMSVTSWCQRKAYHGFIFEDALKAAVAQFPSAKQEEIWMLRRAREGAIANINKRRFIEARAALVPLLGLLPEDRALKAYLERTDKAIEDQKRRNELKQRRKEEQRLARIEQENSAKKQAAPQQAEALETSGELSEPVAQAQEERSPSDFIERYKIDLEAFTPKRLETYTEGLKDEAIYRLLASCESGYGNIKRVSLPEAEAIILKVVANGKTDILNRLWARLSTGAASFYLRHLRAVVLCALAADPNGFNQKLFINLMAHNEPEVKQIAGFFLRRHLESLKKSEVNPFVLIELAAVTLAIVLTIALAVPWFILKLFAIIGLAAHPATAGTVVFCAALPLVMLKPKRVVHWGELKQGQVVEFTRTLNGVTVKSRVVFVHSKADCCGIAQLHPVLFMQGKCRTNYTYRRGSGLSRSSLHDDFVILSQPNGKIARALRECWYEGESKVDETLSAILKFELEEKDVEYRSAGLRRTRTMGFASALRHWEKGNWRYKNDTLYLAASRGSLALHHKQHKQDRFLPTQRPARSSDGIVPNGESGFLHLGVMALAAGALVVAFTAPWWFAKLLAIIGLAAHPATAGPIVCFAAAPLVGTTISSKSPSTEPNSPELFPPNPLRVGCQETLEFLLKKAKKDGAILATALSGSGKTYWMRQAQEENKVLYCTFAYVVGVKHAIYRIAEALGMKKQFYQNSSIFLRELKKLIADKVLVIDECAGVVEQDEIKAFLFKIIRDSRIPVIFLHPTIILNVPNLARNLSEALAFPVQSLRLSLPSREDYRQLYPSILRFTKEQQLRLKGYRYLPWDWIFERLSQLEDIMYEASGGHADITETALVGAFTCFHGPVLRAEHEGKDPKKAFEKAFSGNRTVEGLIQFSQSVYNDLSFIDLIFGFTFGRPYPGFSDTFLGNKYFRVFSRFRQPVMLSKIRMWDKDEQGVVKELIDYGILLERRESVELRVKLALPCFLSEYPQLGTLSVVLAIAGIVALEILTTSLGVPGLGVACAAAPIAAVVKDQFAGEFKDKLIAQRVGPAGEKAIQILTPVAFSKLKRGQKRQALEFLYSWKNEFQFILDILAGFEKGSGLVLSSDIDGFRLKEIHIADVIDFADGLCDEEDMGIWLGDELYLAVVIKEGRISGVESALVVLNNRFTRNRQVIAMLQNAPHNLLSRSLLRNKEYLSLNPGSYRNFGAASLLLPWVIRKEVAGRGEIDIRLPGAVDMKIVKLGLAVRGVCSLEEAKKFLVKCSQKTANILRKSKDALAANFLQRLIKAQGSSNKVLLLLAIAGIAGLEIIASSFGAPGAGVACAMVPIAAGKKGEDKSPAPERESPAVSLDARAAGIKVEDIIEFSGYEYVVETVCDDHSPVPANLKVIKTETGRQIYESQFNGDRIHELTITIGIEPKRIEVIDFSASSFISILCALHKIVKQKSIDYASCLVTKLFSNNFQMQLYTPEVEIWIRRFISIEDDGVLVYCLVRAPWIIRNLDSEKEWRDFLSALSPEKLPSTYRGLIRLHQNAELQAGRLKKCLVLDCDGVLWSGIVGEDGVEGIKITAAYLEFQKKLKELKTRGVILAINSKNNLEDVTRVFESRQDMVLKKEDFALIKANWQDKATNLKQIATELHIGMDALVFFDDSPQERELAMLTCPEVLTPGLPYEQEKWTALLDVFELPAESKITDEDRRRTELYDQIRQREGLKQQAVSQEAYYRLLEIKILICEGEENLSHVARLAQLSQRTNQFNLTTRRYSEQDIEEFLKDSAYRVFSLKLSDRFGDAGIVGLMLLRKVSDTVMKIEEFCLSCRAIGLSVERAFLSHVMHKLKKGRIEELIGVYIPSGRNILVESLYQDTGFVKYSVKEIGLAWRRPLVGGIPSIDWIDTFEEIKILGTTCGQLEKDLEKLKAQGALIIRVERAGRITDDLDDYHWTGGGTILYDIVYSPSKDLAKQTNPQKDNPQDRSLPSKDMSGNSADNSADNSGHNSGHNSGDTILNSKVPNRAGSQQGQSPKSGDSPCPASMLFAIVGIAILEIIASFLGAPGAGVACAAAPLAAGTPSQKRAGRTSPCSEKEFVPSHLIIEDWRMEETSKNKWVSGHVRFYFQGEKIGSVAFDVYPEEVSIYKCETYSYKKEHHLLREFLARVFLGCQYISDILGMPARIAFSYYTKSYQDSDGLSDKTSENLDKIEQSLENLGFVYPGADHPELKGKFISKRPYAWRGLCALQVADLPRLIERVEGNWIDWFYGDRARALQGESFWEEIKANTDWAEVLRKLKEHKEAVKRQICACLSCGENKDMLNNPAADSRGPVLETLKPKEGYCKVMIYTPSEYFAYWMRKELERVDGVMEVDVEKDAQAAIKRFRKEGFNILITEMYGFNDIGVAVAEGIRDRNPQSFIIGVTSRKPFWMQIGDMEYLKKDTVNALIPYIYIVDSLPGLIKKAKQACVRMGVVSDFVSPGAKIGDKKTALLIDDEKEWQDINRASLQDLDFSVHSFYTIEDAAWAVKNGLKPDLIVLDISLAVEHFLYCTEKTIVVFCNVPILFLFNSRTIYNLGFVTTMCMVARDNGVVLKLIEGIEKDRDNLVAEVTSYFGAHSGAHSGDTIHNLKSLLLAITGVSILEIFASSFGAPGLGVVCAMAPIAARNLARSGTTSNSNPNQVPLFRLLVFDMDLTLYVSGKLSEENQQVCYQFAQQKTGLSIEEVIAKKKEKNSMTGMLRVFGLDLDEYYEYLGQHADPYRYLVPDQKLIALLERLRGRFQLAVVTNNGTVFAQKTLASLGISELFDYIVTQQIAGKGKPDPRMFELACSQLGVDPKEALSIGDRKDIDLDPAEKIGMVGILVKGPQDIIEHLEERIAEIEAKANRHSSDSGDTILNLGVSNRAGSEQGQSPKNRDSPCSTSILLAIAGIAGLEILTTSLGAPGAGFVCAMALAPSALVVSAAEPVEGPITAAVGALQLSPKLKRVLVVEDDRSLARYLERRLKAAGAQVELALDVREAKEKISRSRETQAPFDLILTDIILHEGQSEETGFDLVNFVNPKGSSPTTMIVVVSGMVLNYLTELSRLKNEGRLSDYIEKDYISGNFDYVIRKINACVAAPLALPSSNYPEFLRLYEAARNKRGLSESIQEINDLREFIIEKSFEEERAKTLGPGRRVSFKEWQSWHKDGVIDVISARLTPFNWQLQYLHSVFCACDSVYLLGYRQYYFSFRNYESNPARLAREASESGARCSGRLLADLNIVQFNAWVNYKYHISGESVYLLANMAAENGKNISHAASLSIDGAEKNAPVANIESFSDFYPAIVNGRQVIGPDKYVYAEINLDRPLGSDTPMAIMHYGDPSSGLAWQNVEGEIIDRHKQSARMRFKVPADIDGKEYTFRASCANEKWLGWNIKVGLAGAMILVLFAVAVFSMLPVIAGAGIACAMAPSFAAGADSKTAENRNVPILFGALAGRAEQTENVQILISDYEPVTPKRDKIILTYPYQPRFPTLSEADIRRVFDFKRLGEYVDLNKVKARVSTGAAGLCFDIVSSDPKVPEYKEERQSAHIFGCNIYIDNCQPNNPADWKEGEAVLGTRLTGGYTNPIIRGKGFQHRLLKEVIVPMVLYAGFEEINAWTSGAAGFLGRLGFSDSETDCGSIVYSLRFAYNLEYREIFRQIRTASNADSANSGDTIPDSNVTDPAATSTGEPLSRPQLKILRQLIRKYKGAFKSCSFVSPKQIQQAKALLPKKLRFIGDTWDKVYFIRPPPELIADLDAAFGKGFIRAFNFGSGKRVYAAIIDDTAVIHEACAAGTRLEHSLNNLIEDLCFKRLDELSGKTR